MKKITFNDQQMAIDLGTENTMLYVRTRGVTQREPTLVAINKSTGKMMDYGMEAQKKLGRTPADISVIHPVVSGVISDYDLTTIMLSKMLSKAAKMNVVKPVVLVCVPSSITGVEERALIDSLLEAGARRVYLVESAVATASGAGIDSKQANGHMVIDIGAGTTEIAVVTLGGISVCKSLEVAGNAMDEAIIRYIRTKYKVLIGPRTAQDLKINIGRVDRHQNIETREVKGRSLEDGKVRLVEITSNDIADALQEPLERILDATHLVMENTPPELMSDLTTNGIVLSGGCSLLRGIDALITSRTGVECAVVDDPLCCAAYGAGKMLRDLDNMKEGMQNFARRGGII